MLFGEQMKYILVHLQVFPFQAAQPWLVSEKIAQVYRLTPGQTVEQRLARDVIADVISETFKAEAEKEKVGEE